MTEDEKAFLAQIALGWFAVRPDGTIWRNVTFHGGGATWEPTWIEAVRAERSTSAAEGGYLRVMFNDAGTRRKVAAHRIVWMVCKRRDIPDLMEINHEHEDGNKQRNDPNNLELVVRAQNVAHAIHVLGKIHPHLKASGAKMTPVKVIEIRELHRAGQLSLKEIGRQYGLHWHSIQKIVTRQTWKHVP